MSIAEDCNISISRRNEEATCHRSQIVPIGSCLSIIKQIFGSKSFPEALNRLKLSLSIRLRGTNTVNAKQLQDGLQQLKSLKSLDLSFARCESLQFFKDCVDSPKHLPIKTFRLKCLSPLPSLLQALLMKRRSIEGLDLCLVAVSSGEWCCMMQRLRAQYTLVSLALDYINIDDKGLDFTSYTGKEYDEAELKLKEGFDIAQHLQELSGYLNLREEPCTM